MHIISIKALRNFWLKHSASEKPFEHVKSGDFNHLKQIYNSVDYVRPYTIFDVAGNNLRIIAVIHYNTEKIYIRHVLTHREYDDWNKLFKQGKVK